MNYREGSIKSWRRSRHVHIINDYNQVPSILFDEELITIDGDLIFRNDVGGLSTDLSDPMVQFNIRNPETDEVIGTSTFMEAYVILYSIYRHLAIARDNQGQPQSEPQQPDAPADPPIDQPL
jgi:hypothetical protein